MQTRWKVLHHPGIRPADGPTSASAHLELVLPQNVPFRAEVPRYQDILSGDPNGATATGPGWRMGVKPERFPPVSVEADTASDTTTKSPSRRGWSRWWPAALSECFIMAIIGGFDPHCRKVPG